jgi:hypothetical protein
MFASGIGSGYDGDPGTIRILGGTISSIAGWGAAGIGGGDDAHITISGGDISAQGGINGAGIGGCYNGNGGEINISGGIIESVGGEQAAGIGGGINGVGEQQIIISGGTILATGGDSAAGIGLGNGGLPTSTTEITGGSINADSIVPAPTDGSADVFLNKLTVDGFGVSLVTAYYDSLYGINDVYTDVSGKLYFYLPFTGSSELVALSFDPDESNKPYYGLDYQREDNDENEEDLEYLQLSTPSANIDFINKKLTGLLPDANYDISIHNGGLGGLSLDLDTHSLTQHNGVVTQQNGSIIQANGEGEISFDESCEGYSIDIVQSYTIPYSDSEAQVLDIPGMPAVPGDSAAPLGLAGTGLDLDLAYILMVLLLEYGTVLRKRVTPVKTGI